MNPPRDAQRGTPVTVAGWKALAQSFLSEQECVFLRNLEISARYAEMYSRLPSYFKWAGMAAFASHHVRLALFPFRLDADRTGFVDVPRSLGRRKLLIADVDTIRMINNGIFDDIFWVHLAYGAAGDGIGRVRVLLGPDAHYAAVLAGFETIDRGRRILEDASASPADLLAADDLIWEGNIQLLEHEQRALVQPNFDRLSCGFARLFSLGSALSFEVRGARQEAAYFTSFYLSALGRGAPHAVRARTWPRMTRYDDRWWWITTSIVPRFRKLEAHAPLITAGLRQILDHALSDGSISCIVPPPASA